MRSVLAKRQNPLYAFECQLDLFRVIDAPIGAQLWWVKAVDSPALGG